MNRRITASLLAVAALTAVWMAPHRPATERSMPRPESANRTPPSQPTEISRHALPRPSSHVPVTDSTNPPTRLGARLPPATPRPPDPVKEAEFAAFDAWVGELLKARAAGASERTAQLEQAGVALAQARRRQMEDLIESDPQRAIELSIGGPLRSQLSEAVQTLLEERVRGVGDLDVLAALTESGVTAAGGPAVWREATLNGTRYRAFVFGRRLGDPTLRQIPLLGVALASRLAVADTAAIRLSASETTAALAATLSAACAVCGATPAREDRPGSGVVLETMDGLAFTCGEAHADELVAAIEATAAVHRNAGLASAGTTGVKRLILIRVDFPDLAGAPFTDAQGVSLVQGIHDFYWESSYNRAGFRLVGEGSIVTPTYRMPKSAAYYGSADASELRTAARDAARLDGLTLAAYDYDLICMGRVPGFGWAGLGYVGAPGAWIRASFDGPGVSAHELGHNFGLPHANFWDTAGESVIGSGTSVEYGDSFDTMGSATAGKRHFNARYKNLINWLPTASVATFTTNGVYRVHAHDLATATGIRALKVRKDASTNYWVEFRQKFTDLPWAMNGAGLRWSGNGSQATRLLDVTPGSPDGKNDSPLVIGRTFSDTVAGLHVTPLAAGSDGTPYLDVAVNQGAFTNVAPPTLALAASRTNFAPGTTATFTASATAPGGGDLAYHWDFGDASLGQNRPSISHSWTAAGFYRVRCTVSNLKGGTATASSLVRVGTPTTFTLAGRVQHGGVPLADVRVTLADGKIGYTDTDGRYWITGVVRGSTSLKATQEGYLFSHPAFTNPINVSASLAGLDFEASRIDDLELVTLVPAGARWRFLDNGSNQGTAWRAAGFADTSWDEGNARFGYGDNGIVTTISYGSDPNNKYITTYFRHAFTVTNPGDLAALTLGLLRDDGAVVYLNGREVFRSNLPTGTIGYRTAASSTVGGAEESTYFESDLDPAALRAGSNVLAVEVHQASGTSSDVAFDLRLTGIRLPPAVPNRLSAEIADGSLQLSWPADGTAWTVESSFTIGPGILWTRVPGVPQRDGDRWLLAVPLDLERRFYRLSAR